MSGAEIAAGWAHRCGLVSLTPPGAPVGADDRAAIGELLARFAIAYDERRLDVLAACFTPDAVYQVQLGPEVKARFVGVEAITAGVASVLREQGDAQRRHSLTNLVADRRDDATVRVLAYATVVVIDAAGPALAASAVYRAQVIPAGVTWKLRELVIGMDSYMGTAPQRP